MATGSFGLRQLPERTRALFGQDRDRVIDFKSSIDNPKPPVKRFNLVPGKGCDRCHFIITTYRCGYYILSSITNESLF